MNHSTPTAPAAAGKNPWTRGPSATTGPRRGTSVRRGGIPPGCEEPAPPAARTLLDAGEQFSVSRVLTPEIIVALTGLGLLSLLPAVHRRRRKR